MAARVVSCAYNINYLPDEVLCAIISLLPIEEAVRTSILSRRWRHLFTLMTDLDFETHKYFEKEQCDQFLDFVDRLVLLQDKSSIVRFRVSSYHRIDPERVNRWICALVRNKIQEFVLWSSVRPANGFTLPESLFSCESLVILDIGFGLGRLCLKVPDRICLPRLKVLRLKNVVLSNDGSEARLVSSCPILEDLVLELCFFCESCVKFNVSNENLKRLTLLDASSKETMTDILINAPSLVIFNYSISTKHTLVLLDVKCLAEVVLHPPSCISRLVLSHELSRFASQFLRMIRNIQTIKISYFVVRDLQLYNEPIPLFEKMKCLKIWNWESLFDPICLEYVLARCVSLETLVFDDSTTELPSIPDTSSSQYSMRESQLAPLLCHLKTIEIQLLNMVHINILMGVIQFFLENAVVLEELKVSSKQRCPEEQVKAKNKLMSFTRASKNCRVLLL